MMIVIPRLRAHIERKSETSAWKDCWEAILRLPLGPHNIDNLYDEAAKLVRSCYRRAGNLGFSWFEWQVMDGQLFVTEELAKDPDNEDWKRIDSVLAGAQAGMSEDE